jgi:amidase
MTNFSVADRPVWQWSACDLADAIRRRQLSAVEALEEVLRHIADVNPRLNAIVDDTSAEARHAAEALDGPGAGSNGLLSGVPVTVKDIVDQAGRANTNGVAAYAGNIATQDAPVVTSLRASGALIVGRTNTPEFSLRGTTVNELYGRTYNPWNDWASAGGS